MKKCLNCRNKFTKGDVYCRNCGVKRTNGGLHYIFMQVLSLFAFLLVIGSVILLVASYLVD